MDEPLQEIIRKGGCYWRRLNRSSPGHSVAIPTGTPFKIALDGPNSRRCASGTCMDGAFVLTDPPNEGQRFLTAAEAVAAVRAPSTNAFLYVEFLWDGSWVKADDLRRRSDTILDSAEEVALQEAIKFIEGHRDAKGWDSAKVTLYAAAYVAKNPDKIENARSSPLAMELVQRGAK